MRARTAAAGGDAARQQDGRARKAGGRAATGRLALAALLALALLGAGCGGDDDSPSSADVPEGAVATVDGEEISEQRLDEEVEAVKRAQSRGGASKLDEEQLEQQALISLLQTEWLEQEAEKRGIEVSMGQVSRRWRSAAREQFKTKKAMRRFLGGQTEEDVLRQLRLQALTAQIHQDIRDNADGDPDKAVERFQQELQESAQGATACREGYDAPACVESNAE